MPQGNGETTTRRGFLTSTAGAALAGWALSQTRANGANERIRLGIIGCGGRGTYHIEEIEKLADSHSVEITAVCDVWRPNLEKAAARIREKTGKAPFSTSKYGELLARPDVDGVIIATPDHAHCPILTAAAQAKKTPTVKSRCREHSRKQCWLMTQSRITTLWCRSGLSGAAKGNSRLEQT